MFFTFFIVQQFTNVIKLRMSTYNKRRWWWWWRTSTLPSESTAECHDRFGPLLVARFAFWSCDLCYVYLGNATHSQRLLPVGPYSRKVVNRWSDVRRSYDQSATPVVIHENVARAIGRRFDRKFTTYLQLLYDGRKSTVACRQLTISLVIRNFCPLGVIWRLKLHLRYYRQLRHPFVTGKV